MTEPVPHALPDLRAQLEHLALDLRWTWSHEADALWQRVDPHAWERTRNPWATLRILSESRLIELCTDSSFLDHLGRVAVAHRAYLDGARWFDAAVGADRLKGVAYFSMEFGLSDALPLYAGGLGILAGDLLKTASDLGVPVVGVGLLFGQGYFRQSVDASGWQQESYPYNDTAALPVRPVENGSGSCLRIPLEFPGRTLFVRVWRASVGRGALYLLETNDPLNTPADRGITAKLYEGQTETRLLQEIVLGVAGWRAIELLHPEVELCHINEGHAALAVLERARSLARRTGMAFGDAWAATRAGTVFTTHTSVGAGFDRLPQDLVGRYLQALMPGGPALDAILALGRAETDPNDGHFNMAYLAARGSIATLAVSRSHENVSRTIFQPLYPRWPACEVPIGHVTNAVHVPSWDSAQADAMWTDACGKDRWRGLPDELGQAISALSDEQVWAMRGASRSELVQFVRERLATQLTSRGHDAATVAKAASVLDPNALTLGFARRFTGYKRPDLLLHDPGRIGRILCNELRPAQIVIAGKAHPEDLEGKRMIREWIAFANRPEFRHRVVFLEDYDIALAQELVKGVDLWINTPRRPWEACGTSGMKILVNGGLNLSELDGWWAEAFAPELGWAIGGGPEAEENVNAVDAESLYAILEQEVTPQFYERDVIGIPRAWLSRIRHSMGILAPRYCSTRMIHDYLKDAYLPAARAWRERTANSGKLAAEIAEWERHVRANWPILHIGPPTVEEAEDGLAFTATVYLGDMRPDDVRVELYADPGDDGRPVIVALRQGKPLTGTAGGYIYSGRIRADRPAGDFTVRIVPHHSKVLVPAELALISWQR